MRKLAIVGLHGNYLEIIGIRKAIVRATVSSVMLPFECRITPLQKIGTLLIPLWKIFSRTLVAN